MTHLEQQDLIPPIMARLYARVGRLPLQNRDLAERLGWTVAKVAWLGKRKTWTRVFCEDHSAFLAACGVKPGQEWRVRAYWVRTFLTAEQPLAHLAKLPKGQRRRIARNLL